VAREDITAANARLSATDSVAEVAGPALAGVLFQWLGGPYAIAVNALTYLASAGILGTIAGREPEPKRGERVPWGRDVADGVRAALAEPRVAPLLFRDGVNALFGSFFSALYVIFALRIVGLNTALLGLAIACGGLGALCGALVAPRLARLIGVGPAIVALATATVLSLVLVPLAPARPVAGMSFLVVAQALGDALWVACDILAASLRQTLVPQAMLGRVAATFQMVVGALGVTGALVGGALGGLIGPRDTLYLAVAGMLLGPLALACSSLRTYRGGS
jgi:predicted MFS family arabinose efflux permease